MAAGQNVPACHFPADTSGERGGSVSFVLLAVAFSSGARRALQHSVRGQKLRWATPATTSKDVPCRKADTPQHTHTHTHTYSTFSAALSVKEHSETLRKRLCFSFFFLAVLWEGELGAVTRLCG